MKIGYARVSTKDQHLDLQFDALYKAGCSLVFEEQESGAKRDRPELQRAIEVLKAGDTLVVYKLDRLSRSLKDLIDITGKLQEKGAFLVCTSQAFDTSDAMGQFFYNILGAIAELERGIIKERTMAGLESARKQGRTGGRPKKFDDKIATTAKALLNSGMSKNDVCNQLGFKRATLYRLLAAS
jgi:DNA invertase Pin-like site-specific DNA recombinase